MRFARLIFFYLFIPVLGLGQTVSITGKVTNANSKEGVAKANVFLSNSSFGTETTEDGSFTLPNVKPGQYQLVVSYIGYTDYTQTILVGHDPISLNIQLSPKTMELRGVVISSAADWKKNYELFKKQFIGSSENSKKCEVINPHVVNLVYHSRKKVLEAWSDEFLVMENRALGYRVKFLIDTFSNDGLSGITSWAGKALFEELPGTAEQKREWKQKRQETYYGSSRHFLKSLYSNTLDQDGFILMKLSRQRNPARPDEDVIQQKMKIFRDQRNRDSLNYWIMKENLSHYAMENLNRQPLQPFQVFSRTNTPGLFVLSFTDCLYIMYTKRREETDFKDLYRPLDMPNYETSVLTLYKPYAVFDMNGVIIDGSPLNEGTWSKAKLPELLPFNYSPEDDK